MLLQARAARERRPNWAAAQVRTRGDARGGAPTVPAVPGIAAALRGMAFIETVVAASRSTQKWHAFPNVAE